MALAAIVGVARLGIEVERESLVNLAAGVFGLLVMLAIRGGLRGPRGGMRGTAGASIGLSLLPLLGGPADVRAETPRPDVLQALEARLTAPPDCFPDCTSVERAGFAAV